MGHVAPEPGAYRPYDGRPGVRANDPPPGPPPDGAWQWIVEAGSIEGPIPGASQPWAGGLRVAVADEEGLSAQAATSAVEEAVPAAVLVGFSRWPAGAGPAALDPAWDGAQVRVEWLVSLRARGARSVDVEAVPRLVQRSGASALVEEYRLRRVVPLGQALLFGAGGASSTRVAEVLVGARDGKPWRFALRVR
jgi:hypothetical protein